MGADLTFRDTMPSALYEIVRLSDGDYALQRTDEVEEPLVRIRFSEEALGLLGDASLDIARVMIDAGIDAVEALSADFVDEEGDMDSETPPADRVLH